MARDVRYLSSDSSLRRTCLSAAADAIEVDPDRRRSQKRQTTLKAGAYWVVWANFFPETDLNRV
jgi:hypothetical protein